MVEEDLTLEGGHSMKYADDVKQNCMLQTYIIVLINVTPVNFNIKNQRQIWYDFTYMWNKNKNKTNE